jgi:hypothetical protein
VVLLDDVVAGVLGAAVADGRRRRWGPRGRDRPAFVRVVDTPWLRVAAGCLAALIVVPVVLLLLLAGALVAAMADDTLGLGLVLLFGPVALAGMGALVPIVAGGVSLAHRTWSGDGSTRVPLALAGAGGALLLGSVVVTVWWWPLLLPVAASVGLFAIAVAPAPWKEPDYSEWSKATSTANS